MEKDKIKIILGTAHLGTTPGKCSPDKKFREAVYSREIVEDIKYSLHGLGYAVLVDYPDLMPNNWIKSNIAKTEQNRELAWRVNYVNDIAKKYGKNNCLYVSIHVNGAGNGSSWMNARGWSAYTSPGNTKSDLLAEDLYWAAKNRLQEYSKTFDPAGKQKPIRTDLSDGDSDMEGRLYVLVNTICPAVLTENLFQDNKEDVKFLQSDAGKFAITRIHVEGILKYIHRES